MADILELSIIQRYKDIMLKNLKSSFPKVDNLTLNRVLDNIIKTHYVNNNITLDNTYTKQNASVDMIQLLDYIDKNKPIINPSGVLYNRHENADNPYMKMIKIFMDNRTVYKGMMKDAITKYGKNSYEFNKYNLFQLLEKRDSNASYGLFGTPTCMFYNVNVAESITGAGRSAISNSIMLFEGFLGDNIKFNNFNEIIMFIDNICNESSTREYQDSVILDRPITREECFNRLINNIDNMIWIPSMKEKNLLWDRLLWLSPWDINRIYYKNNLYAFCDNKSITNRIINMLQNMNVPYIIPHHIPASIVESLQEFTNIITEYVYYRYPIIDKLDRISYMKRDIVVISDTDSTIISINQWYEYVYNKIKDLNIGIDKQNRDLYTLLPEDENGEYPKRDLYHLLNVKLDYDFINDKIIKTYENPMLYKLNKNDDLKYSIINIIIHICGILVLDYLNNYCNLNYSNRKDTPSKLKMKNEFAFSSVMLTDSQRNYVSCQVRQEDKYIDDNQNARLAVTGLSIDKSVLPENIKKEFKKILYEDIMSVDVPDQINIMKKMIIIEKSIIESIKNGESTYYKPDSISPISSYEYPMRVNGIKACIMYNEIKPSDYPSINLNEHNFIYKIKCNINKHNIDIIKDTYPEVYENIYKVLNNPALSDKLDTIGFPLDAKVPEWIIPFVNIGEIINSNLSNFPLESVGLKRLNDNVNYSNIIQL